MSLCPSPIPDATLLEYWARDLADGQDADRLEEHLFACGVCSARLDAMASLGAGLTTLLRQGRVSGIVSRALLNRMQRNGVIVRLYSLAPGDSVPCCVYPADDLIVTALRADLSAADVVTLSVTASRGAPFNQFEDVPVSGRDGEVLWATPAAVVRALPSTRLELTLASADETRAVLGTYVLEHSALPPREHADQ
jgi:hypothetical protein